MMQLRGMTVRILTVRMTTALSRSSGVQQLSPAKAGGEVKSPWMEFAELPETGNFLAAGMGKDSPTLPSVHALASFHTSSTHEFARTDSWGMVRDVKNVNQVRMVGAIRMAETCMKCHEGKRGDLLGAFSYDLVRDPAFIAVQQ